MVAGFGALWRVLGMANYRAYVYCDKCDRPLRENEYRSEIGSGDTRGTTYYCRLCNSTARKPFGMPAWVVIALLTCGTTAFGVWIIDTTPVDDVGGYKVALPVMAAPLALWLWGWWKKSKCKPIYDRWVMQHGINPDKWPDAPKPNRTPENRTKSEPLSKRQLLVIWVIIIVWGAVVAWMNYDAGVFD